MTRNSKTGLTLAFTGKQITGGHGLDTSGLANIPGIMWHTTSASWLKPRQPIVHQLWQWTVIISAKAREYVLPALVCASVCMSVTTITKKTVDWFVSNFMGRFLGEREDQVPMSLRSVGGCGNNGEKTP